VAAQFKVINGRSPARAHPMNSARDQLFFGTGFTEDQYCGVGGRNEFHLSENPLQHRTTSYDLREIVLHVYIG
jgi:hypothetical protein